MVLNRPVQADAPTQRYRHVATSSRHLVSINPLRTKNSSKFFGYARALPRTRRPLKLELLLFVCMRFQDLFHSPSGVLLTFPSQYWFTIGRLRVFSLGGWSPHIQTGFHVSRPTCRAPSSTAVLSHTGLSPAMAVLSRTFRLNNS
jgi:hypothetical protein